jgi:hypothetical protein
MEGGVIIGNEEWHHNPSPCSCDWLSGSSLTIEFGGWGTGMSIQEVVGLARKRDIPIEATIKKDVRKF